MIDSPLKSESPRLSSLKRVHDADVKLIEVAGGLCASPSKRAATMNQDQKFEYLKMLATCLKETRDYEEMHRPLTPDSVRMAKYNAMNRADGVQSPRVSSSSRKNLEATFFPGLTVQTADVPTGFYSRPSPRLNSTSPSILQGGRKSILGSPYRPRSSVAVELNGSSCALSSGSPGGAATPRRALSLFMPASTDTDIASNAGDRNLTGIELSSGGGASGSGVNSSTGYYTYSDVANNSLGDGSGLTAATSSSSSSSTSRSDAETDDDDEDNDDDDHDDDDDDDENNNGLRTDCEALNSVFTIGVVGGECVNKCGKKKRGVKGEAGMVKGPWTAEEDETLMQLVDKYGPKKWKDIATFLPSRIAKQCRERWCHHLCPGKAPNALIAPVCGEISCPFLTLILRIVIAA